MATQKQTNEVIRVGNTLTNLIDKVTKQVVTADKVTTWWDGTPMNDAKVDGYIYRKAGNEYFRKNLGKYGELFLEKDTVAQLRTLSYTEILLLKMNFYKGVKLNGYYTEGDTPAPVEYYLSDTTEEDNGGSVFEVSGIKLEHDFKGELDVRYFGVIADNITDNTDSIQKIINSYIDTKIDVVFPSSPSRYLYSDTLSFGTQMSVLMYGVLDYRGTQDKTTIVIGNNAVNTDYNRYIINIISDYNFSLWDNENFIGVRIINTRWCDIEIKQASCFTYGVEFFAYEKANVFNEVTLGHFEYCKAGVVLNSNNDGWVNENNFYGGSIRCRRGAPTGPGGNWAWEGKSRYGIIIKSQDGYRQNSNLFHKPSIELRQQDAIVNNPNGEAVAIVVKNGRFNSFKNVRDETNTLTIRTLNDSTLNKVKASFTSIVATYNSRVQDLGLYKTTIFESSTSDIYSDKGHLVFNSGVLTSSLRGLGQAFETTNNMFFNRKDTGSRSSTATSVSYYNNSFIQLNDPNVTLGVNIDVSINKRYLVSISPLAIGNQGRLYIITRNASNERIGTSIRENYYVNTGSIYSIGYNASIFNGAYQITGQNSRHGNEILVDLEFTDEVYSADILIGQINEDDTVIIRDFAIYCIDGTSGVNKIFNNETPLKKSSNINFNEDNFPTNDLVIDSVSETNLGWKVITVGGTKVKIPIPILNQSTAISDITTADATIDTASTATDVAELVADFNDLVTKFNAVVALVNATKSTTNSILTTDRTSGQRAT